MANGFPDANPTQGLWPYLHYLFDHQADLLGGFPGKSWYVDALSGNTSDTDGNTWQSAFGTMAQAFAKLSSGDRIYFKGKVREQLDTPVNIFDVTIIGIGNRPHHADATPAGGNIGQNSWTPPASPTAATPLLNIRQQGWKLINILFQPPTDAEAVRLYRNGGAGDLERDASHATVVGCRFAGGMDGIGSSGQPFNVRLAYNIFHDQTGFALRQSTTIADAGIANPLQWEVMYNRFLSTNNVKMAFEKAWIQYNEFGAGGNPNTTVVLNTAAAGNSGNNTIVNNYFHGTTANFNTPDVVGGTGDVWTLNCAIDTVAPGTSGVYEVGIPA